MFAGRRSQGGRPGPAAPRSRLGPPAARSLTAHTSASTCSMTPSGYGGSDACSSVHDVTHSALQWSRLTGQQCVGCWRLEARSRRAFFEFGWGLVCQEQKSMSLQRTHQCEVRFRPSLRLVLSIYKRTHSPAAAAGTLQPCSCPSQPAAVAAVTPATRCRASLLRVLVHPARGGRLPLADALREPERDLLLRALHRIGTVDDVPAEQQERC